ADLGGYNSNRFDIPLLVEELNRVGVEFTMVGRKSVDVQSIFHKKEKRTLEAAVKFYCDKDLDNAHSAEADISATIDVLMSQLERYDDLEPNVDFLNTYTRMNNNADLAGRISFDDKGVEIFNFGKHKGLSVQSVFEKEPSYYDWMMRGNFPQQTKQVITAIRLRSGIGQQGKLI
ncbi:MAG: 3'-5' exonuclease, partial [Bacteroidia bacterium]|nr:3'-5' exonuclease [Bacteroidia bacterium]